MGSWGRRSQRTLIGLCPPFPCSQTDSASLSASLLADWLEGHGMNPSDIESLQREIQMDSPMLLADLPDLQ